ncbi:MAG: NADH-quinone oxidoreductase subunit N [candidate division NC10 bacterium RIFCSPLOWO2_12_FULL_66_18]|nr:MAG: NADH-quinone oxidoreductase subunit N [candidate division NC10 bacterium RIFCSPLOWO2_12_FULL_66_18]
MTPLVNLADLALAAPEIVITVTGLLVLLLDVAVRGRNRGWLGGVSVVGVTVALGLVLRQTAGPARSLAFSGLHVVDNYANFFKVVFLLSTIIVILLSARTLQEQGMAVGEFNALLLFATLGTMLMASAVDLLSLFVGLETMAVSTYALCGFLKGDQRCNEGALKYLLMGVFSTGVVLYGMVLLYGFAGSTNLEAIARAIGMGTFSNPALLMAMVLLAAGFGFKIAAVPFHMYLPDMYEGAPTPVVAFMAGAAELAGLAVLVRVFLWALPGLQADWSLLFWVLAVLTMTIGNLVAIAQANIKRMLAYSTIAHMGYLLIGPVVGSQLGVAAVLFYSLVYACMTIGAFGMVILLARGTVPGDQIDDFTGLAQRSPLAAAIMLLFLLSLTGIPPTAGFVGKFYLFAAAVDAGYIWLVLIAVINSAISLFYYMRVVMVMYMRDLPPQGIALSRSPALYLALFLAAAVTLLLGIFPGPVLEFAKASAAGIAG